LKIENCKHVYKSRYIFLAAGVICTMLFLILNGPVYWRLWIGDPLYTDGVYDFRYNLRMEGITTRLALATTAISWVAAAIYYYVVNSVRFDRYYNWLMVAMCVIALSPIFGFALVRGGLNEVEPGLGDSYDRLNAMLQIWTALLGLFWFVVASYSIRWWSSNCRHTPFPQ